jgi:hypothetical protein
MSCRNMTTAGHVDRRRDDRTAAHLATVIGVSPAVRMTAVRMTAEQASYYRGAGTARAFVGGPRRAAGASPDVRASLGRGCDIPTAARHGASTALERVAARPSLRSTPRPRLRRRGSDGMTRAPRWIDVTPLLPPRPTPLSLRAGLLARPAWATAFCARTRSAHGDRATHR